MFFTVLTGLFFLALFLLWNSNRRPKNFPPGPTALPIIGNLHQYGLESFKGAVKLQGKYGPIQGFSMACNRVVIFNDPNDIREICGMPEFSSRTGYNPLLDTTQEFSNYGVINSFGDKWHHNRRFSLKTLRDFGFAKRTSEAIILEEVKQLREEFKRKIGQAFPNKSVFNIPVFNVIWSLLAGQRYNQNDARLRKFVRLLDDLFTKVFDGATIYLFLFPWLLDVRKTFPFLFPTTEATKLRKELYEFFLEVIAEHRATHQVGQPRDFIDAMIDKSLQNDQFVELDFLVSLMDFFIAGSETTSTTLRWAFFLMANFPDIQEKAAAEILDVARDRDVSLSDRPNLPYIDAVTQEIFRCATLVPGGIPHGTSKDIVYKGYFIPKDTLVLPNIYATHFAKDLWGDPENFRPERFYSPEKGKAGGVRNKAWIPFGVGKRSCLGESLARDEFFLFFTELLRSFVISFPEGEPRHSLAGVYLGAVRSPVDHNILLRERA